MSLIILSNNMLIKMVVFKQEVDFKGEWKNRLLFQTRFVNNYIALGLLIPYLLHEPIIPSTFKKLNKNMCKSTVLKHLKKFSQIKIKFMLKFVAQSLVAINDNSSQPPYL